MTWLFLAILALPLLAYVAVRCYAGWSPGIGSPAPGVTWIAQPSGIPVANSASGAAQTNTATIPAAQGKVNYLEGFDLTGGGATSAGQCTITITGLAAGTLTLTAAVAAGANANAFTNGIFSFRFPTPLPAGSNGVVASNAAISVAAGTYGAGNTQAQCTAYGIQA